MKRQFSEMTASCSEKPKGGKEGALGLLHHEKRMCWVTSSWCTQVYQRLLVKNSILSFKAPASPRLLLFKASASLRPLLDRQPRNTGGSLRLPFTNSTASGLSNGDLGSCCENCTKCGAGGKGNWLERKFNLGHPQTQTSVFP